MEEAKGISSMISNKKLSEQGSDYFDDPTLYSFIVEALQYGTISGRA